MLVNLNTGKVGKVSNVGVVGHSSDKGNAGKVGKVSSVGAVGHSNDRL